jgi:hypothetical protein
VRVCLSEIAGQAVALPVEAVEEVFVLTSLTPVPGAPAWVLGATSRRGHVLPILHPPGVRSLPLPRPGQAVLVLAAEGRRAAIPIDATHGIQEATPGAEGGVEAGGRVWRPLDPAELLRGWEEAMGAYLDPVQRLEESTP